MGVPKLYFCVAGQLFPMFGVLVCIFSLSISSSGVVVFELVEWLMLILPVSKLGDVQEESSCDTEVTDDWFSKLMSDSPSVEDVVG